MLNKTENSKRSWRDLLDINEEMATKQNEENFQSIEKFIKNYFLGLKELYLKQQSNYIPHLKQFFSDQYVATECEAAEKEISWRRLHQEIILAIECDGEMAEVIVNRPELYSIGYRKYRFHLLNTVSGWKIEEKERWCNYCDGSGVYHGESCWSCKGRLWI